MATEQTPIGMAIEALEACIDDFGNRGSRLTIEMSREAIAALRAIPTPPQTLEEAEEYLRSEGIDPEEEREYGTKAIARLKAQISAMPTQESADPVAWKWQQLMHGYMGGWHSKCEQFNPLNNKLNRPEDIKMLTPLYTHPPKPDLPRVVLTDEEIKRILNTNCYEDLNDSRQGGYVTSSDHDAYDMGMLAGLRYARDHGYIAPAKPFPVDEVMDVVNAAYTDGLAGKRGGMEAYRARLTARFGQQ